jgi:alkylation response protein AidB-like acyl-CoA dehydrogenase
MSGERIVPGMTPEQVRAVVRRFNREVVEPLVPHVYEWQDDIRDRVPWEAIEEASRRGLRTLGVPAERGGGGAGVLTLCHAAEELARGEMGIAVVLDQTWKCQESIEALATDEQKDWFYSQFMDDHRYVLAIAMTEPDTGTDKYIYTQGAMKTVATKVDGGWRLIGRKRYISNAADAKLVLMYARTTPDVPLHEGVTCFLVTSDSEGYSNGEIHEKISQRMINNAEIVLDDVFVPDGRILGAQDRALGRVGNPADVKYVRGGNVEAAATTLGTAMAAMDAAMRWGSERIQGGVPVIEHQVIAHMMADAGSKLEAARSLVWRAAQAIDDRAPEAPKLTSMAKYHASATAVEVTLKALEVFGGAGIMMDQPIQKYLRDVISFLHSDGTQQTHAHRVIDLMRAEMGA